MHLRCAFVCFPLVAACLAVTAAGQKVDGDVNPIVLRSGSGVTRLTLVNNTQNPMPVDLKIGPILDLQTGVKVSGSTVTYEAEPGEKAIPPQPPQPQATQLEVGKSLDVVVSVSNLAGTSMATMKLFNQSTKLVDLTAVSLDDALNVSIDGNGSSIDKPLTTVNGSPATIVLKNGSAEFLAFTCSLVVNGAEQDFPLVDLPPSGSRPLTIALPRKAFSLTDWVQPSARTGELRIKMLVPKGIRDELVPIRVLPVNLMMMGASANGLPSFLLCTLASS